MQTRVTMTANNLSSNLMIGIASTLFGIPFLMNDAFRI